MNMLLQKSANHSAFLAWLAGEFRLLSKKRNKLAMLQTFEMKTGGATRSALTIAAKRSRYLVFHVFLLLLGPSFRHRPIIASQHSCSTATAIHSQPNYHNNFAQSSLVG